jgi:hypothetical protein
VIQPAKNVSQADEIACWLEDNPSRFFQPDNSSNQPTILSGQIAFSSNQRCLSSKGTGISSGRLVTLPQQQSLILYQLRAACHREPLLDRQLSKLALAIVT